MGPLKTFKCFFILKSFFHRAKGQGSFPGSCFIIKVLATDYMGLCPCPRPSPWKEEMTDFSYHVLTWGSVLHFPTCANGPTRPVLFLCSGVISYIILDLKTQRQKQTSCSFGRWNVCMNQGTFLFALKILLDPCPGSREDVFYYPTWQQC